MNTILSARSLRGGAVLLAFGASLSHAALIYDSFDRSNGLVTNEYAYYNPSSRYSITSPIWQQTSGSFFINGSDAWSGVPDAVEPNARSTNGTGSAIFRLTTRRNDFKDVAVSFDLLNKNLTHTAATPAAATDGVHVWLRHLGETALYAVSVNRRDNKIVVKKKVSGGTTNGGTYYQIGTYARYYVSYNRWTHVKTTIQTNSNGSVTIAVYINGTRKLVVTDSGMGGAPIRTAGHVGLRGDNCNFKVDNFRVDSLATRSAAPSFVNERETAASGVVVNLTQARVFPNPWRADLHGVAPITFDQLTPDGEVRVFTVAGQAVKHLTVTHGQVTWDRTNESGESVASGLYLYLITNAAAQKFTGKLAIVR
jgi:hypothetical protein